jgi:hypothetical protein
MTSQLNYLIARQRQAELVSRAQRARLASEAGLARSASEPRWALGHHGSRARRSRGREIEHELKLEGFTPRDAAWLPENPVPIARAASLPSASPTQATYLRPRRGSRRTELT